MRMISQTTASFSPLAWLNGLREHSSSPPQPCSMKLFFHLYPCLVLIPYSWHRALKFLLPNNFNANSIFWFIGSTFFHGIRQTIEICRRSVTYVLNHLCYLCIEPGPVAQSALPRCPGTLPPTPVFSGYKVTFFVFNGL